MCKLTDAICSLAFNVVKLMVVDISWTLWFCFRGVTHEWMSSIFEVFFLFLFLVMSLLSSLDEIDVRVGLLSDYLWEAEDDKTGFLSVGFNSFELIVFEKTTNFLAHGSN